MTQTFPPQTSPTVAIIGLGLIGGSLGLALGTADPREAPLGRARVVGYDSDPKALKAAKARLAIDVAAESMADAAQQSDIVVIATPVQAVREVMAELAPHLRHGTLVMDTASSKAQVMEWARELLPATIHFVGGHPMAGSESAGIDSAEIDLFRGAIFCLCPSMHAKENAVDTAFALVETIGAKPYAINPAEHDAYVAGVSHLPFLLSVALMEAASRSPGWVEMQPIAASGFRDVTRLASGDPTMHRDICLTNGPAIEHWIDESIRLLVELREQVRAGEGKTLERTFRHAQDQRERWLFSRPGIRPSEGEPIPRDELRPLSLGSLLFGRRPQRRNRR